MRLTSSNLRDGRLVGKWIVKGKETEIKLIKAHDGTYFYRVRSEGTEGNNQALNAANDTEALSLVDNFTKVMSDTKNFVFTKVYHDEE